MVGLSVVLESHNYNYSATSTPTPTTLAITEKTVMPLVVCKPAVVNPPPTANSSATGQNFRFARPPASGGFLDACFLCRQSLLPGKDIYMYKGDKAFCSEECRWKQMLMDDSDEQSSSSPPRRRRKEITNVDYNYNHNCTLAVVKPTFSTTRASHHRKPFAR